MNYDFKDIRNHGFMRVAVVIPRVSLANPMENSRFHFEQIQEAYDLGAEYILCPELGLTGYSCQDLFFDSTLQQETLQALNILRRKTSEFNAVITVGAPVVFNQRLFNCAITMYQGVILGITPKMYPPEYREFYELRHFTPGYEAWWKEVDLLGQKGIPFGSKVLIQSQTIPNFILHVQVCEDGWTALSPGALASLAKATVIANLSASNITIDKDEYRDLLFRGDSGRFNCAYMYSAAGFGESTSDLAWDGDGFIAERGVMLARTNPFEFNGSYVLSDIDLELVVQERQRQSSWHQNAAQFQDLLKEFRNVEFGGEMGLHRHVNYTTFLRPISPTPYVPLEKEFRDKRCWQIFNMQATSLARRLIAFPESMRKLVIGVSGGQDSTQALLVAVRAMDLLELPRTNVIALTMPGFGTTGRTKSNALGLMAALGVTSKEVSIIPIAEEIFKAIGHDRTIEDATFENTQAWSRKFLELATAAEERGMDLGTGDLSELALGWCTMFGDHASHYGVNSGIPKTLMTYLIEWAIDGIFSNEPEVQNILRDIVNTPISPELKSADSSGGIAQKTEDELGPYELYDFYMYYFVRFGFSPTKIARLAAHAFVGRKDRPFSDIRKYLEKFLKRFFSNQYKRNCLPDGPKIGLTSLSPRGDWRMPSDAQVSAWLRELEKIPTEL